MRDFYVCKKKLSILVFDDFATASHGKILLHLTFIFVIITTLIKYILERKTIIIFYQGTKVVEKKLFLGCIILETLWESIIGYMDS